MSAKTVKQLIEELAALPQEAEVYILHTDVESYSEDAPTVRFMDDGRVMLL